MWWKRKPSRGPAPSSGRIRPFRVSERRCVPTASCSSAGASATTSPRENSRPTTDACSSTMRSTGSSRSSRSASNAWIVGGRTDAPPSSASAASCSANSGFPSAASRMRRRASGSRSPRPSSNSSESCSDRGSSGTTPPVSHDGRRSASSGRARQSSRTGACRMNPARYSSRSSNVGSAQWMSSTQTISGRSAASVSSRRRAAQKISSLDDTDRASGLEQPAQCGDGTPGRPRRSSAASTASAPPAARTSSTTGQNVIPSP